MRPACLLLLLPMLSLAPSLAAERGRKDNRLRVEAESSPPGFEQAKAELEGLQKEIEELRKRFSDAIPGIQETTQAFQEDRDFEAMSARRQERRASLDASWARFFQLVDEFDAARTRLDEAKVQHAIGRMMSGGTMPANAPQQYLDAQTQLRYSQELRDYRRGVIESFRENDAAFKEAEERARTRRMLRRAVAAFCGVLLAGAGLFWFWRMRARKDADAARTRTVPAQLMGPARRALPGPSGGDFNPGSVVAGSFRIDRELGRGGMGVVYEATDMALNRKVAIKKMHDALARAGEELERFLAEARMVASLKHPNIVDIYAISRDQERLLLVFEFVAGTSLSALLKAGRRLPLRTAKSVVKQAAAALDHAHANKIIHRDLKPSNVMVTPQGRVKVMDFGIAHHASVTMARLTRAQAWGSPPYMALEHEMGAASRESDLFSLGACVYEVLCGRPAFSGPNFQAQKQRMLFTPLGRLLAGVPPELDALMARALHPDPRQRFHSGAEFAAAFDRLPG